MIESLLPAGVQAQEIFGECEADGTLASEGALFPEEEAFVVRAVEKRRREFRAVRRCARTALGRLGIPPLALVPGIRGAPTWPRGVIGSMTHCAGYAAAAVARVGDLAGLGIDAEPHDVLPEGVLGLVALPQERAMLERLADDAPHVSWDRVLFSAKESVYKCWFPLTGDWLGFEDAEITLDRDGSVVARLLIDRPDPVGRSLRSFPGRWLVADGFVLTAVTHAGQRI